jgi:hypothetical protein
MKRWLKNIMTIDMLVLQVSHLLSASLSGQSHKKYLKGSQMMMGDVQSLEVRINECFSHFSTKLDEMWYSGAYSGVPFPCTQLEATLAFVVLGVKNRGVGFVAQLMKVFREQSYPAHCSAFRRKRFYPCFAEVGIPIAQ